LREKGALLINSALQVGSCAPVEKAAEGTLGPNPKGVARSAALSGDMANWLENCSLCYPDRVPGAEKSQYLPDMAQGGIGSKIQ